MAARTGPSKARSSREPAKKAEPIEEVTRAQDTVAVTDAAARIDEPVDLGTGEHLEGAGENVAAPVDGLGNYAGDLLTNADPMDLDDLSGLTGPSTSDSGLEVDLLTGFEDPFDLDVASVGLADGRTGDDGFELGDDGPPEDYSDLTGDGLAQGAAITGAVLAFGNAVISGATAVTAAPVLAAGSGGYAVGSIINDAGLGDVIQSGLDPEGGEPSLGEGEPVDESAPKTNEPDEESNLLEDADHGTPTDTSEETSTEPEQSTEPDPDQAADDGSQSVEPVDDGGQSVGEPDTTPTEDRGPDGADPEMHEAWLARQDPSILETYLQIEENARAGAEVNPNPMADGLEMTDTPVLADQIDYGEDHSTLVIDEIPEDVYAGDADLAFDVID